MKTLVLALFMGLLLPGTSIHDFKVNSIDPDVQLDFAQYRGKKILVVNTASNSAYTYQLEGLQQLYSAYRNKLVVVGFPCGDDFGQQELKSNKDILNFCRSGYGITFPLAEKTNAVGTMRHPVFAYLTEEARKLGYDEPVIKWNFTKFLIDEEGQLLRVFPADVTPMNTKITSMLNNDQSWKLN